MRNARRSGLQFAYGRRGTAFGVALKELAARLHQDNPQPDDWLAECNSRDDGAHCHDVRRKLAAQQSADSAPRESGRNAADESAFTSLVLRGTRSGTGSVAFKLLVGHKDQREHDNCNTDEAHGKAREVGFGIAAGHWSSSCHWTRTLTIWSRSVIEFITSSPPVIWPNTVCTPFRCLVLASLSTIKNCEPPVSLPA